MPLPDDEDFDDFMAQVDEVNKVVQGLKDGTIDPRESERKDEKLAKERSAKAAAKEAAEAKAKAAAEARAEEKRKKEEYKEEHREELEKLKTEYYRRKARRERWEEFRANNRSRAFSDYYQGWEMFEEDPDEELFSDPNKPAAVEDQAAFDVMAKDVEERSAKRKGAIAAADRERSSGNLAFAAGQYTEAVAAYSRAIEHFKGGKPAYANRAAAHLKLGNYLSALDDCSRASAAASFFLP